MASNKTEAAINSRGKGRQQVLEDLALEFPVVDGQWTPTVKVAEGVSLRLVSTCRHLGTQDSHGARRGPELAARRSPARAAYQATRKKILSQRRLSKKAGVAVARAVVSSRLLYGAGTQHSLSASDINDMEDTYMAPFRTIANERWRPGYVPASSQEVCRRLGLLDFREAVSMQRLRLAAEQVNASPSLMALLQSDAGRAWKAELFCDIELLRQEKGPQLVEVEGLPDFEKLWFVVPEGLEVAGVFVPPEARGTSSAVGTCTACSRSRSSDLQLRRVRGCLRQAPGPSVTPDESASATAGSTPLRPRFDLPRLQGGFPVETEGHSALEVGAERCVLAWKYGALEPFLDDAVAGADQLDCAHRRQCKREGRSHLAGPPMLRGGADGE